MTSTASIRVNRLRERNITIPPSIARRRFAGPGIGGAGRASALLLAMLALAGCETARNIATAVGGRPAVPEGTPGFVQGFLGGVAAEEPRAAAVAREILSAGGNAGDAAVAAGFAMAVTLPSRVGLGGGGACLVYNQRRNITEAVVFMPGARLAPTGERPAAVPLMARGLFALHTRFLGGRPFESLIAPAEQMARFGVPMPAALHGDLTAVRAALFADADARATYGRPDGGVIEIGTPFRNPALSATLAQLRANGVGDMHQGALAARLAADSARAGGGTFTADELRTALPQLLDPQVVSGRGGDRIALLPPPADGGLATAAALEALGRGASPMAAQQAGLEAAARQRSGGASLPMLPASAGLVVYDREGNAVSCAFTMNNLFGTGRTMPGMGFLLAAAPGVGRTTPPLLSAAIAWAPAISGFRMAVAGSGQRAAHSAVAVPLHHIVLRDGAPADAFALIPEPGRAQIAACARYLPGREADCTTLSDPRGLGVALGAVDR